VPESRSRRKADYIPPPTRSPAKLRSRAWVAPTMVACFLIGLIWIVLFYLAGSDVPGMSALGNWNLLVGFGFIGAGFIAATQWR